MYLRVEASLCSGSKSHFSCKEMLTFHSVAEIARETSVVVGASLLLLLAWSVDIFNTEACVYLSKQTFGMELVCFEPGQCVGWVQSAHGHRLHPLVI